MTGQEVVIVDLKKKKAQPCLNTITCRVIDHKSGTMIFVGTVAEALQAINVHRYVVIDPQDVLLKLGQLSGGFNG